SSRREPLESAAERIARETLEALGEVVDPEQEQPEPAQERHGRGGVHRVSDAGVIVPVAIEDYGSPGRDALRRLWTWILPQPEVSDADGVGQADRRAGRVRLGAPHDHGDHRFPPREATLQLVALPVRRDLLPVLRGYPVPDLLARHVTGDGLPP